MNTPALNRRRFLRASTLGSLTAAAFWSDLAAAGTGPAPAADSELDARVEGLLLGSLIGDALGGPVEFQDLNEVARLPTPTKRWLDDEVLDAHGLAAARDRLILRPYAPLRPAPEPYAHWSVNAPPGTVTDDSRHKIVLLDCLRTAQKKGRWPISARTLAQTYLDWPAGGPVRQRPDVLKLNEDWLREWHLASRWQLGERKPELALPPERLWSGLPTCCGQMTLPPLAALFPGKPDSAYRAAYSLAYFDNGWGRDLNAALVAGLAEALTVPANLPTPAAWERIYQAMRGPDPYRYREVPWTHRSVDRWLDLAQSAAREANRHPARLFQRLETEFRQTIKWEAQVPFVVAFAVLALCDHDPLAALQLSIEWGHDTDSYAQLVGAFIGARHGVGLFPERLARPVRERLAADYGQDVREWVTLLQAIRRRGAQTRLIADFGA